ncbi:MAG: tRNA (cytidine(56)-2'-O)-methyltransferase [Desulfurococcaceae archaeon]
MKRKIYVLRYGHRVGRDKGVTHVALVRGAFGANGFILGDVVDESIYRTITKVIDAWEGELHVETGVKSFEYCENWKKQGGLIVHLTMYGLHVDEVIEDLRRDTRDLLIVVGAKRVPGFFYEITDYNVAIGHQPHSEIAALAVFLDKLFEGRELYLKFNNAKLEVIPSPRGKSIRRLSAGN